LNTEEGSWISRLPCLEREQLMLRDVLTDLAADQEAVKVIRHGLTSLKRKRNPLNNI